MTHSYFDSRLEGDTFWSQLTDAQKSKGVKAYFEETTEPSFGEEAAPQVLPTEKPSIEQQAKDIKEGKIASFEYSSREEVPEVFKDKIVGEGVINGKPSVRVRVAQSLADYELGKAPQVPPTPRIPKERAAQLREQIKIEEVGEEVAPAAEQKKLIKEIEDFASEEKIKKWVDENQELIKPILDTGGEFPEVFDFYETEPNLIIGRIGYNNLPKDILRSTAGHGITRGGHKQQLKALLNILSTGKLIGDEALLSGSMETGAHIVDAYNDGDFMLIAKPGKTLKGDRNNLNEFSVVLNGRSIYLYDKLKLAFPNINFIKGPELSVEALNKGTKAIPQVPAAPEKAEPIRQLGTGSNVYFETDKYRVNDFKDKTLLNVSGVGDTGTIANIEFNTPEEAVEVGKTLSRLYPNGVPEAVLLDKVVEDIKAGKYKEEAPITEEEIKTKEYAVPEQGPEGLLQPAQEGVREEGGERRGVEPPVERIAAAQKSKAEATQKEIDKRLRNYAAPEGKQTEVNKLVNEVSKFNNQRRGRLGLKSSEGLAKRNQLLIEAKRLGFETRVDREGRIRVKGAKAIDKSYSNMAIDKKFVPLKQRGEKLNNLFDRINGVADAYGYDFGFFMPNVIIGADGRKMDARQIKNALKDLNEGIPSKGANAILNSLEDMAETGYVEVRVGQDVTRVSVDEYFQELEKEAKQRDLDLALARELDTLPEKDLVKWVEEMADEQSFEKEEYEPTTEEPEAEGGKEPETAATREQAIREAERGAVPPVRRRPPTAEGGPKLKEVVPPVPPTPTKTEGEEEYVPKEKKKALLNRLYTAKNIPEEARIGFEKEGLRYQTKSQKEAELIAKGVIDEVGIDEALNLANSFEFDGDVNSLIYAESLNRLAKMEKSAKTSEEKQALAKKFAEVGIQYGEKSQYGGRFNAAINYFYEKSPLGIVIMENTKREEEFSKFSKNQEQSWKEAFDIIKTELDALKQELQGKNAEPSISVSEAKVLAARQKRAALKEKYKKGKGGGLTLTTGGLTKEGIEYVGELVVTYIQEGVANVEVIIQRIFLDLKDTIGKPIDEETAKQVEGEARKVFKEKKGKSVLNKIRKKLKKLSKKKQYEVVRKSFNQIIESGGLEYDDFRKIIAEVTGYSGTHRGRTG
jgi:hypothetical protein